MSAMDRFHPPHAIEQFRVDQDVAYNWEYDATRRQLLRLYENAKRDQWNATSRLDWSIDVDPHSELVPDMAIGIYGTKRSPGSSASSSTASRAPCSPPPRSSILSRGTKPSSTAPRK